MNATGRRKVTRRFSSSCLIFLGFAAVTWFILARFMTSVPEPPRNIAAGIATFFLALGAFSFWGILSGGGNSSHTRKALIRRAESGGDVTDGEPMITSGTVQAAGDVLLAPLSGTPCVAYFYRMYYWGRGFGTKNGQAAIPVYWGLASRPFVIEGVRERRRVQAVPRLQMPARKLDGEVAYNAAREWIASTNFEAEVNTALGMAGTAFAIAGEMFSDESGSTRRDWKLADGTRQVTGLTLEETVIPIGAQAAVCGTWSEQRKAVVAGEGLNGVMGVSVSLGGPRSVPEDAVANKSTLTYLISATVLSLVGVGIVWLARILFKG